MKNLRRLSLVLGVVALSVGATQLTTAPAFGHERPCVERCRNHAQETYRHCMREHNDPDRCATHAREEYRKCLREHCQ